MAEDPGHKVMLYFLEILMYSNAPIHISQLVGHFGSRNFTSEMRQSAGGNEAGLRKFLLKYPSLFALDADFVSLNDGTSFGGKTEENSASTTSGQPRSLDVCTETDAVQYFKARILKKGEKWMPVRSLAGHLSQASLAIRECVGPQTEFLNFLLKHPFIFEVVNDNVCLKDNIHYNAAAENSLFSEMMSENLNVPVVKQALRPQDSLDGARPPPTRTVSIVPVPVPNMTSKLGPATMTANEYKAVMFLKNILLKKGDMKVNSLSGHFCQAPDSLRNTIGWSKLELYQFISSHAHIFHISEDEMVSLIRNTRLNVIITGSRPNAQMKPYVNGRKGEVFHVAKLWGIIDLGMHEHVFIDRTIFGKNIDDLNKVLKIGEWVYFDAIPAPKGSRARWRATKVWKEHESIEDLIEKVAARFDLPIDGVSRDSQSPIGNMNDEIRKIYPELDDSMFLNSIPINVGGIRYSFQDAASSNSNLNPTGNFHHVELEGMKSGDEFDFSDEESELDLCLNKSEVLNNKKISPGNGHVSGRTDEVTRSTTSIVDRCVSQASGRERVSVACQTIVTGDVLATHLFHEDL